MISRAHTLPLRTEAAAEARAQVFQQFVQRFKSMTDAQVARVLATIPGRAFQVAGHTDNVPIDSARFPSNWELSTARAVEVVKLLVSQGVGPKTLSAAGYGEFDPVASNDAPDGRAKNRRIEITLQPNLDELVVAPQAG
jgi:chemotaxis protein MotB